MSGPPQNRIVVLVAGKDPEEEVGGHSFYVRSHARAAMRAGYEPHLFCVSRSEGTETKPYGIVHRVKSPYARARRTPGMGFRSNWVVLHAPLLRREISRFLAGRSGHVLVHGFGVWGCAGTAVAREVRGGPRVTALVHAYGTILHENDGKQRGLSPDHGLRQRIRFGAERLWIRFVLQRYEGAAYREARVVLINYESVRRLLVEKWGSGISFEKMTYAPETAFADGSPAPRLPDDAARLTPSAAPLLVSASRQDPRKGVDVLLRALARLRGDGVAVRACLLGGGPLLSAHRELARRLGLGDSVALPGFVPDSFAYTRHADVFVLPSLEEGSGSVALLEAMQAGVACVASRVDGIPEDVDHGRDGLLVEPGDPAALAESIRGLIADDGLRRRLAAGARTTFEERFSASALTDAVGDLYARLEKEPPSARG